MYQCVVRRQEGDTFQASAELQLGGKKLCMINWLDNTFDMKKFFKLFFMKNVRSLDAQTKNTIHLFDKKKVSFHNKKNFGILCWISVLYWFLWIYMHKKKKLYSIEFVARFSTSEHLFLFSNELVYNKYRTYHTKNIVFTDWINAWKEIRVLYIHIVQAAGVGWYVKI